MAIALLIATLRFDALTAFGLVAVTLMLVFYALESRSNAFVLAFAAACILGSVYGFLQGAWPFGLVEGFWSMLALRRWLISRRRDSRPRVEWTTWRDPPPGEGPPSKPRKPRTPQSIEHWMNETI